MIGILRTAEDMARSKFQYVGETIDQWRSHADDVMAGRPWTGDCDDLASTVCHLAINNGFPKKDLWFAMVSSRGTKIVDHLVGIAKVDDDFFVIGDTFGTMYKLKNIPHRLLFVHNLSWTLKRWQSASTSKDL